jgi:hypothetical protein
MPEGIPNGPALGSYTRREQAEAWLAENLQYDWLLKHVRMMRHKGHFVYQSRPYLVYCTLEILRNYLRTYHRGTVADSRVDP